jgi:hypothetical protein
MMIQARNADIFKFQSEMEDAFRLDCNPDDIKVDKDAKKLNSYIRKCRKKINRIRNLSQKILCEKKSIREQFWCV